MAPIVVNHCKMIKFIPFGPSIIVVSQLPMSNMTTVETMMSPMKVREILVKDWLCAFMA